MPATIEELKKAKRFIAKGSLHCEYELVEYDRFVCQVKMLKAGENPVTSNVFGIKTDNLLCAIEEIVE